MPSNFNARNYCTIISFRNIVNTKQHAQSSLKQYDNDYKLEVIQL